MKTKTLIVIPARFASTRLPGKMLLCATGKPLICHVYERALKAKADKVIVATDDQRIVAAIKKIGGDAELTKLSHQSGTDRVAEVVSRNKGYDIVVNIQGDEPEIEPASINKLIELQKKFKPFMSTLCCRFPKDKKQGHGSPLDPACVKVVLGKKASAKSNAKYAIYFSRNPIPYPKSSNGAIEKPENYRLHIGMYAFSPSSVKKFTSLSKGFLESVEGLEQLRAIEEGFSILVDEISHSQPGIDTPEDYRAFVNRWNKRHRK